MKKLIEKIKKLSFAVKVQLLIAIMCTMAIPVYAWFTFQDRIEALTKVKEPPSINLASGGDDPALYINLENIDVSVSNEKYIVFSVEPGKYASYDIQLSHTTNIPFTYELFRVSEDENGTIEYTDHTRNNGIKTKLKYSIMTTVAGTAEGKLTMNDINPDDNSSGGRILGSEELLTRKNYSNTDNVNQYVKPLYSVSRSISKLNENEDGSSDRDYFAIRLTWKTKADANESEYWNFAFNNKETDIIYISAKQSAVTGS